MGRLGRNAAMVMMLALASALAACGSATGPAAVPSTPGPGSTEPGTSSTFDARATLIGQAWKDQGFLESWTTGFVPLNSLVQEAAWPTSELKAAFGNGWIQSTTQLAGGPAKGSVKFADGSTLGVRLIPAAQTLSSRAPSRVDPCPVLDSEGRCQWVTVTAAKPTTVTIATSRGDAKAPAWAYTMAGVKRPLIIVSVDPRDTDAVPEPEVPTSTGVDFAGAQDLVFAAGSQIDYRIGIGACDTNPRPLVWESADLIVVGGQVTPPPPDTVCTAQLLFHPLSVKTTAPIGDRPIVDGASGQPLRMGGLY